MIHIEENKVFEFKLTVSSIISGYVSAKDADEAREKIKDGEWDDIYNENYTEFGDILDLWISEE